MAFQFMLDPSTPMYLITKCKTKADISAVAIVYHSTECTFPIILQEGPGAGQRHLCIPHTKHSGWYTVGAQQVFIEHIVELWLMTWKRTQRLAYSSSIP